VSVAVIQMVWGVLGGGIGHAFSMTLEVGEL
jgi:hypothetical protein